MIDSFVQHLPGRRIKRMGFTRRKALAGLGLAGLQAMLFSVRSKAAPSPACPFRLAVINDEITPDFERACQIASQDFGLSWIELRSMWNKNVTELNAKELEDARKILAEHK